MGHLNLSVFCKQTLTTYTAVTIMKIHEHGIKCITTFSAVNAVYASQTGLPLFVALKFTDFSPITVSGTFQNTTHVV